MLNAKDGFSSFSSNDLEAAHDFYGRLLGLDVAMTEMGLAIRRGSANVFVYPKENHEPATFTVLNLFVDSLEAAVDALAEAGVEMERYPGMEQDERGIARAMGGGPDICWFTDPAGNIIALMEGDLPAWPAD
jgi:catechol 2,3-dioxygenase-like lactoylglutathione lyase family enzyme